MESSSGRGEFTETASKCTVLVMSDTAVDTPTQRRIWALLKLAHSPKGSSHRKTGRGGRSFACHRTATPFAPISAQPLLSPSVVRLFLADSNQLEGSVCV